MNEVVTKEELHALMGAMIAGLPKLAATITGLGVEGQTYTPAALATAIGALDAPYAASAAADLAAEVANKAIVPVDKTTRAFISSAVTAAKAVLGKQSPNLKLLGIEPDQVPTPLTAEQKVEKSAKAKATRQARGTLGKRQKAAIHGTVPAASTTGTTSTGTTAATPAATAVTTKTGS